MLPGNKLLNINLDVTALNTADINKNWKKKADQKYGYGVKNITGIGKMVEVRKDCWTALSISKDAVSILSGQPVSVLSHSHTRKKKKRGNTKKSMY